MWDWSYLTKWSGLWLMVLSWVEFIAEVNTVQILPPNSLPKGAFYAIITSMTTLKRRSPGRSGDAQNTISPTLKHPLAMPATVSIEMWERFSFYGMQAILGYYLYHATTDGGLGLERTQATTLLGAYGAFVYLCTLAGGWVADRFLGAEKTLLSGCISLMIGHLTLSTIPGGLGATLGLMLIAIGSGFLKTAAITILGNVYPADDPRRDTGFQLFYLGINIGAVAGPLLTGWLSTRWGFHAGFFAACVLMGIGLGVYLALRRRYLGALTPETTIALTQPPNPTALPRAFLAITGAVAALAVLAGAVRTGIIALSDLATILLAITLCAALGLFVAMLRSDKVTTAERRRLVSYIPIFIASCAFWSVLNQTYGVLAVYSDVRLDRSFMLAGKMFEIPAAWTQSLNPFYILTLSVPMAWAWAKIGSRAPSAAKKMGAGVMITGAGMLVLLPFAGSGPASTPFVALALCVLVVSFGELLVGPVGMSATTAHAPEAYRTRFSALYFLTLAIGTSLAGVLSQFYNPDSEAVEFRYFLCCGVGTMIIGCVTAITASRFSERT